MILQVQNVDTYYGIGHILHGLSLNVGESEVVALLGRNGAGKTTTMRCIPGLTPPRARRDPLQGSRHRRRSSRIASRRWGSRWSPKPAGFFRT